MGVPVELQEGRHGQFDVLVNVSRKGGLMAKLTGKPWPEDDDVVRAVRGALAS